MKGAVNPPFQKSKIRFRSINVGIPSHIFLFSMIDGFMPTFEIRTNTYVGRKFIRHDAGGLIDIFADCALLTFISPTSPFNIPRSPIQAAVPRR